jgi:hypothetical protein
VRTSCLTVAVLGLAALLPGQTGRNAKILHNTQHTDATTRYGQAKDTIYYMQPAMSVTGYGRASGWTGVLQDFDYTTTETVELAFVKYASNNIDPDVTPAGLIANGSALLQFPKPATGNISAAIWTITLNTPATVPPEHGYRLVLPVPANANDGVYIHTQRGRTSKVPVALHKQHTFYLDTTTTTAKAFWEAGTTLWWGGLYEEPVTQMFVNSSLYAAAEDLFGLEALAPNPTAGDKLGFKLAGDAYPGQIGVLLISGMLLPTPIPTPIGTFLLAPATGLIQLPFVLDAKGEVMSPTLPVPSGLKIWVQSAFVPTAAGSIRLSDATATQVQ